MYIRGKNSSEKIFPHGDRHDHLLPKLREIRDVDKVIQPMFSRKSTDVTDLHALVVSLYVICIEKFKSTEYMKIRQTQLITAEERSR